MYATICILLFHISLASIPSDAVIKMSGVEQTDEFGNYSYVTYLTAGEATSMQAVIDTTTHKVLLAGDECSTCWDDGYLAQKYDVSPRVRDGSAQMLTKEIELEYGKARLQGRYAIDRICLRQ